MFSVLSCARPCKARKPQNAILAASSLSTTELGALELAVAEAEKEFGRATKALEVAAGKLATAEPAQNSEFEYQLELAEAAAQEAKEAVVDARMAVSQVGAGAAGTVLTAAGAPTSTVPPELTTLAPSSTVPPEIASLAPSTTKLQGSNQQGLFEGEGLVGGQGVVVSGVATDEGVSVGFYTADGHKVLACKWRGSTLSANSKIGGRWGKSEKAHGAPLTPGDEFTVTITAIAAESVVITAVNNTTGLATELKWPMNVDDVKYIRSYKDGVMVALHPKFVDPNVFLTWMRTPGKCVDATGKDVNVHAISTGLPNEYECLDWCEAQSGTTGCEWYQAKKRCTAHKDASVVRGGGGSDDDLKYVCHVPPPKCACKVSAVQEKSWDATE